MKVLIELNGRSESLQLALLQVANYVVDPVVSQMGLSLDLNNSSVRGEIRIEPDLKTEETEIQEIAFRILKEVFRDEELTKRELVVQCSAARLAELGLEYKTAKSLVEQIMQTTMI